VFVNIPNTAFHDASENYYPGLSAGSAPRFTVVDNTAPVLTEVSGLSGRLPAHSDGIYRFSSNEACDIQVTPPTSTTGEVEVLAEMVVVNQPVGITLQGMKPGGTYSFDVSCVDASRNVSNTLHVGPFTVYRDSTSSSGFAPSTTTKETNPVTTCSADQFLTYPVNIKILQQHLMRLGFNPGPIDGIRGKMTTDAVKKFQASMHVIADGEVGPITRGLINGSCK
jgi:hypothetical protein